MPDDETLSAADLTDGPAPDQDTAAELEDVAGPAPDLVADPGSADLAVAAELPPWCYASPPALDPVDAKADAPDCGTDPPQCVTATGCPARGGLGGGAAGVAASGGRAPAAGA